MTNLGSTITLTGIFVNSTTESVTSFGPNFVDDFTTDNAIDQDSAKIGVNGGQWQFIAERDTTQDASHLDLGFTLSNTWVMDFDFYLNAVSTGNKSIFFAVSNEDSTSSRSGTTKDSIYLAINAGSGTDDKIKLDTTYNSSMSNSDATGDIFSTTTVNSDLTLHFARMVKSSSTDADIYFYTTAERTTVSETLSISNVNALATGLQYIVIHNFDNIGSGAGTLTGYFDNIKVWDGVTSPPS